ncbi:MAG: hypothetical protein ABW101_17270 [Candidatus Thiodiazotropha sp.]
MNKKDQILAVHAQFINQVVMTGANPERQQEFQALLKMAESQGWDALVQCLLSIFQQGRRDLEILNPLDEEDRIIAEAVLSGLRDPATLPDPNARPDPALAAPGLASMIHAAGQGHPQALQLIAQMAEQMSRVGGPMGQLASVIRPLINGERNPEVLCKRLGGKSEAMVMGILEELARLDGGES